MIEINGSNVQNESMEMFKSISLEQTLKLRLKRVKKKWKQFSVTGEKPLYQDWGMNIGVFIKYIKPGSYANKQGLIEFDEIIQVSHNYLSRYFDKNLYINYNFEGT